LLVHHQRGEWKIPQYAVRRQDDAVRASDRRADILGKQLLVQVARRPHAHVFRVGNLEAAAAGFARHGPAHEVDACGQLSQRDGDPKGPGRTVARDDQQRTVVAALQEGEEHGIGRERALRFVEAHRRRNGGLNRLSDLAPTVVGLDSRPRVGKTRLLGGTLEIGDE
jgi:hypothetical protein